MPTLHLDELQTKVGEIASTVPALASETVIIDDGTKHQAIEEALEARGIAVVVGPVTSARLVDQAHSVALLEAELAVEVWENPEQNAQVALKDPLTVTDAIAVELLAWVPTPGERGFMLGTPAISLVGSQPGLRGYLVNITKLVQIA